MKKIDINKPFSMNFSIKVSGSSFTPIGRFVIPIKDKVNITIDSTIKDEVAKVEIPNLSEYISSSTDILNGKFEVMLGDTFFVAWEGQLQVAPSVTATVEEVKVDAPTVSVNAVEVHTKIEEDSKKKKESITATTSKTPEIEINFDKKIKAKPKKIIKKEEKKIIAKKEKKKQPIKKDIYLSRIKNDLTNVKSVIEDLETKDIISIGESNIHNINKPNKNMYEVDLRKFCAIKNSTRLNASANLPQLQKSFSKNTSWNMLAAGNKGFTLQCKVNVPVVVLNSLMKSFKETNMSLGIEKLSKQLLKIF
jgi:hypothetical protein